MVYNLPTRCPVCILGMPTTTHEECNRVILYYFSHTHSIYIKVKGEWCMIVCVIPIKIVIKHFWTLVTVEGLCLTKGEYTKKQIATLLELFSPIIQWTNPSSYNRELQMQHNVSKEVNRRSLSFSDINLNRIWISYIHSK